MTAADISSILETLDAVDPNTEFDGLPVPGASVFPFARVLPDQCQGCPRSADHKVFSAVGINANPTRTQQEALIEHSNQITRHVMKLQSIVQQMNLGSAGMVNYSALTIGGQNMLSAFTYGVTAVSSTTVTCQFRTGDTDPRAIPYQYPNPDYVDPVTTPTEPATLTKYEAMQARGIIKFNDPSSLRNWAGWIFKNVTVGSGFSASNGDTFTITFEDEDLDMSLALTKSPTTSGSDITVTIYQWPVTNAEPWAYQRLIYPMFAKETTKKITPYSGVISLSSQRIVYGSFSAVDQDGNALSLSGRVLVNHTGSSLNLVGYDLTGITSIVMTYMLESSDETGVTASGQDRCKHCTWDPSGSWADDGEFYCAKREELHDLGASGDAILGNFVDDCYQWGTCPYFEEDSPSNPMEAIEALVVSYPYLERTPLGGTLTMSRIGCPSMISLVDGIIGTPSGQHETRNLSGSGGWNRVESVSGTLYRDRGLQVLRQAADRSVPYFLNTSTWPELGPGGGNMSGRLDEYGATVGASMSAEKLIERSQIVSRDVDVKIGATGLVIDGGFGRRQRFRSGEIWIPDIPLDTTSVRNGHTIERGYWDDEFNACSEGSESYRIKITLADPYWAKYGGTVTTVKARAGLFFGSPYGSIVGLYLEHKTITSMIDVPDPGGDPGDMMEISETWAQGMTNVAGPEIFRVWNYDNDDSIQGPGKNYVKAGHCIEVGGHKLWITTAAPCASASYKGSWNPANTTPGSDAVELAWYEANVRPTDSAGIAWPIGHGPGNTDNGGAYLTHWADRLDYIGINDPNLILLNSGTIAGTTYTIKSDGILKDGATVQAVPRGGSTLSTISGAAVIGGSGEIYLPSDIARGTCITVSGAVKACRDTMPSSGEMTALVAALGRMMGE